MFHPGALHAPAVGGKRRTSPMHGSVGCPLSALLLALMLGACGSPGADAKAANFLARVRAALGGADTRRVQASALTDFEWDRLCFERGERLQLTFRKGSLQTVLAFDYTDLFVDEPYVAASLAGRCVGPTDGIVLRDKYPGHAATIEMEAADAKDAAR